MTTTNRLAALIAAAHKVSEQEFLASCPSPVLLVPMMDEASRTVTRAVAAATKAGAAAGSPVLLAYDVVPVRKRAGVTALRNMITVGRADTNDVCIPAREVSKVHAYFILDKEHQRASLTDAGSTNGTAVRGMELVPKEDHAEVEGGDTISLGGIEVVFHTPATFWAYLRTLEPPAPRTPRPGGKP